MKDILKFSLLVLIFTVVIFIINYFFFVDKQEEEKIISRKLEESYVDPVNKDVEEKLDLKDKQKEKLLEFLDQKKKKQELTSASKYFFYYVPKNYQQDIKSIVQNISRTLDYKSFNEKIDSLDVEFFEEKIDTRGKFKDGAIKLFHPHNMGEVESLSVFVHEFAHYVDIYFLQKKLNIDPSDIFYDISWHSTKVKKSGLSQSDFVSGYSMTNKYEDFAESFIYFVFHNDDFKQKAKESEKLKKKYDFFKNIVFRKKEFNYTDFSYGETLDYYWDITKIDIDMQKFLQYLEKGI